MKSPLINGRVPLIEDVSFNLMEFFPKEATGFESQAASLSSPATEWQTVYQFSFTVLQLSWKAFKH